MQAIIGIGPMIGPSIANDYGQWKWNQNLIKGIFVRVIFVITKYLL
jgi:hypothetical protein